MSGFSADQGTGATAVAVLRSTGEPGKASPIRGGGRSAKRIRRREPGKIVAVWSSIPQRAWAARMRCGELSGADAGDDQSTGPVAAAVLACQRKAESLDQAARVVRIRAEAQHARRRRRRGAP